MASEFRHSTPGTFTSALTTELNALANAAYSAASAAITATSADDLFMDLRLSVTYGSAPSAGGDVRVFALRLLDGSAYPDGSASVAPQPELLVASFTLRAVTSLQVLDAYDIRTPPGTFKLQAYNGAGQAMAASGNAISYVTHTEQVV